MKFKKEIKQVVGFLGYEIKKKNEEIKELSFDEILKKKINKEKTNNY